MRMFNRKAVFAAACVGLVGPSLFAADFPETEPNDTKATANTVSGMAPGDTITGTTTGTSTLTAGAASSDNFDVTTTAAPTAGIWRYRLSLTTTGAGTHVGTLRGRTQTAGIPNAFTTDSALLTSSSTTTPARTIQWYANETASRIIYRVTGGATTTSPYTATLVRDPVTPTVIPDTISAGNITFSSIGQTSVDTEFWIYDSSFTAIVDAGNDDESIAGGGTGATLQSRLTRTLAPGTYYLAVSQWNMFNNLGSPSDDDSRAQPVMDFPNALADGVISAANIDLDYTITHTGGTIPVTAVRSESFGILFFQFTVGSTANPILTACTVAPASPVPQGASVTLSTNVAWSGTPGTVTADLSAYGLSSTEALTDNGGGNYSIVLNVPNSQPTGSTPVVITATNPAPGSEVGACTIPITISPCITFTTQPVAASACAGTTASFSAAVNASGTPTFQWETAPVAAGPYTALTDGVVAGLGTVSGATTLNLTISNLDLAASTTRFRVTATSGCVVSSTNVALTVSDCPINDTCTGALPALLGTTTGNNAAATNAGDPIPTCQTLQGKGVWYTFTSDGAGSYSFDTENSAQSDTVLTIYDACGGAQLACDDDSGVTPANSSLLNFTMSANQTVLIQVSTFGSAPVGGGFNLNIAPPPCAVFTTQPVAASLCAGTTATFSTAATVLSGTPTYQWETAPVAAGPYTALTDGVVAGLGIVSGATTDTLTITGTDIAATTTRFRVVVTGDCGSNTSANVALTVIDCPPNDTCATAITATLGTVTGNNLNATNTGDAIPTCQSNSIKGVWYTFNAGATGGTFLIDTEGSAQADTVLQILDSCGGASLVCDDDSGVTPANSSRLTITLAPSQEIKIQVSTWGSSTAGGYTLNISNCTVISAQPTDVTAAIGATANFSVTAAGPGTLTYTWQRDPLGAGTFANLTDGVVAGLGTVSGATTADLSIADLDPAASTDQFRVVIGGSCTAINSNAAVLTVGSAFPARCNGADIAYDNGDFLPRAEIVDGTNGTPAIPGPFGGTNNGVTEADYNVFFANFFDAFSVADIANDDGTTRVPTPAPGTVVNNGVTEGDYNYFFSVFFDGCSL